MGSDHRLWVGTMAGAAVQSGSDWLSYTLGNSELPGESIFALAVQPGESGDVLWFGTLDGVSALDTGTGVWQRFTARNLNLGWGGVADLLADTQGRVWVATLGGGISRWEGDHWTVLTTTNSELPYNSISEIAETASGEIWLAGSKPGESGGVLVRVIADGWQVYRPFLSGFTGGEVMAVVQDAEGKMWFGTRTVGINIYDSQHK
jgi:ligand-binding sensor domain-containing protein